MRKRVAALAAAGLGLTAITLALGSGPRASQTPLARAPRNAPTADAATPDPIPVPQHARNPFEYAGVRAAAPGRAGLREPGLEQLAVPPMPTPEPVRLVGFVERAGKFQAALVVRGEMALLEVGESVEGFTLLGADEEAGVRLRGPDGVEIVLAPEP